MACDLSFILHVKNEGVLKVTGTSASRRPSAIADLLVWFMIQCGRLD